MGVTLETSISHLETKGDVTGGLCVQLGLQSIQSTDGNLGFASLEDLGGGKNRPLAGMILEVRVGGLRSTNTIMPIIVCR